MSNDTQITGKSVFVDTEAAEARIIEDINHNGIGSFTTTDLSRLFFDMPASGQDGIFRPLLTGATSLLRSNGIQDTDTRAALITFLALFSIRTGYPLSVQVVNDDPAAGVKLLDHCVRLAPSDAVIELKLLKPEDIILGSKGFFNGKCIVCPDPQGFSKVIPDIELLLTRGHTSRHEIVRRKYDVTMEFHKAAWPMSFVGVATGKSSKEIFHPAVLRLPVSGGFNGGLQALQQFGSVSTAGSEFEVARLRKTFGRLRHREVTIPYLDQLRNHLEVTKCQHIDFKLAIIARMISICSIINNPPPVSELEIGSALYEVSSDQLSRWLRKSGMNCSSIDGNEHSLTASRQDYYLAWALLDGVMATGADLLTPRQAQIFETIKEYNDGKLQMAMLKNNDDIEKIALLTHSYSYWLRKEKLFEMVNRKSDEFISLSTLNNELMALMDRGIIGRSKPPKAKYYAYYVQTFKIDGTVVLPKPQDIEDPASDGSTMRISNPITGEIEEI